MSIKLSPTDKEQIALAIESGALSKLNGHRIDARKGTVVVTCSDGDQFKDFYDRHCGVCASVRHHPVALAGGPVTISPFSGIESSEIFSTAIIANINIGLTAKEMNTLVLCAHGPCAMCKNHGIDFFGTMQLLLEAKRLLREWKGFRTQQIACFFHLDQSEGDKVAKDTLFVDRHRMEALLIEHDRPLRIAANPEIPV